MGRYKTERNRIFSTPVKCARRTTELFFTDGGSSDSHPSRSREEKQRQKKRKGTLSLGSKDNRHYDNELDLDLLVEIKRARKETDAKETQVVNVGGCDHGNTTELRVFL
jgi:hypothetical protein